MLGTKFESVYLPMGITSENVASAYNISRRKQDEYSVLVSVERGMGCV